jgi:hypothetical protein
VRITLCAAATRSQTDKQVEADAAEPGVIRVRLLPRTYAGALTGVYGTSADVAAFLREEHAAWE